MSRSWMLAAPAALVLLVGCADSAPRTPMASTMPMPMPMALSSSVQAPVVTPVLPEPTPIASTPRSRRAERNARFAPASSRGAQTPGSEQSTSGPSAVGRAPQAAQPVGNGGS